MIALLSVQTLIDRIVSECPAYNAVNRCMTSQAVIDDVGQIRSPHAFVLEPVYSPSGGYDGAGNNVIQTMNLEIGVLTGFNAMRDTLGNENESVVDGARQQLWSAFLGWMPEGVGGTAGALGLSTCRPFAFQDGVFWYVDTFQTLKMVRT